MSILVYFLDNVHLALVLLHFNLFDLAVCFRVKSLDDAFNKVLGPLSDAIHAFLQLPLAITQFEVSQQSFLLAKMRAVLLHWEAQSLGVSFSVPFFRTVLSLNIGLLISIVAATTVRCLNVVVYGFWPALPRLNLMQLLVQSLLGPSQPPQQVQQGDNEHASNLSSRPSPAGGASKPLKPPAHDGGMAARTWETAAKAEGEMAGEQDGAPRAHSRLGVPQEGGKAGREACPKA